MVCLPRRGGIPVGSALVRDVELRLPLSEALSAAEGDFFFPARFQTNRFAAIPPRVRFGLRLAHLVGMTNKGARENRQSLSGGDRRHASAPRDGLIKYARRRLLFNMRTSRTRLLGCTSFRLASSAALCSA